MRYLLTFLFCVVINSLYAQTCNCDSVINSYKAKWNQWVSNSDSFYILKAKMGFIIKSEKDRDRAIKLILKDKWTALMLDEKKTKVNLILGLVDTVYGRKFISYNPDGSTKMTSEYASKENLKKFLNQSLQIDDVLYKIYFHVGNDTIIFTSICDKKYAIIKNNIFQILWMNIASKEGVHM